METTETGKTFIVMLLDMLKMLLPQSHDSLDLLFFTVVAVLTLFVVWVCSKPPKRRWLDNWDRFIDTNKHCPLDMGAINDINKAIITQREKWCHVFPNLALIIGLLGTFIGITLALGDAGDILREVTKDNREEQISKLTGLVGGMGIQFKSSIYGVIGFIIMRLLNIIKDERRLRWVKGKTEKEIAKRQEEDKKQQEEEKEKELQRHNEIVHNLNNIGNSLEILKKTQDMMEITNNTQKALIEGLQKTSVTLANSAENITKSSDKMHGAVVEFSRDVKTTLETIRTEFVKSMDQSTKALGDSVKTMSDASEKSYQQINESVGKIKTLVANSSETLIDAKKAMISSQDIIDDLSNKIEKNLGSISNANITIKGVLAKLPEEFMGKTVTPVLEKLDNVTKSLSERDTVYEAVKLALKDVESSLENMSKSLSAKDE